MSAAHFSLVPAFDQWFNKNQKLIEDIYSHLEKDVQDFFSDSKEFGLELWVELD